MTKGPSMSLFFFFIFGPPFVEGVPVSFGGFQIYLVLWGGGVIFYGWIVLSCFTLLYKTIFFSSPKG
jgi:hypothetical protein